MLDDDTSYQKFLKAHNLSRRANQLAKEINALFADAREQGLVLHFKQNRADVVFLPYRTEYMLGSNLLEAVAVSPVTIGVVSG